jgi:hypothetical protein
MRRALANSGVLVGLSWALLLVAVVSLYVGIFAWNGDIRVSGLGVEDTSECGPGH